MESLNDTSFIVPCGMNCGICMAYLREKNKCPGCRGADFNKPVTRVKCKIKNCVIFQLSKAKYCFECEKFPCDNLKHLDKRYRTKYNMSMVKNLENIKTFGIRTFLRTENKKWTCSECGGTILFTKDIVIVAKKRNSHNHTIFVPILADRSPTYGTQTYPVSSIYLLILTRYISIN